MLLISYDGFYLSNYRFRLLKIKNYRATTDLVEQLPLGSEFKSNDFVLPSLKDIKYRINQIVDPSKIIAIKIRQIVLSTEEIALQSKRLITSDQITFEKLATDVSLCLESKRHGGETGWIILQTDKSIYTEMLPADIVNAAIYMNKGDINIVKSSNYYHVIQVLDIETRLEPSFLKRRKDSYQSLKGYNNKANEGKTNSYYMETMGCQMNVADSERMEAQLINLGYSATNDSSKANVIVLNTCSVRDHAEQKVYSYLGPFAQRKRNGEDISLIIAGCVAQQEGEVLARRFPELDIIMGPQYANRLGDLMEAVTAGGEQIIATEPIYQMEDTIPSNRQNDITAFINVIYGCNERCSFCVVPTTRGVEQSRTKQAIIKEIEELVSQGYLEVTLLGQNVDSWGR